MTQIKITENESEKSVAIKKKKIEASTAPTSKYINDKFIQIAAWILLTLGLCMVSTAFYLAIGRQQNDQKEINNVTNYDQEEQNINSILNFNISGSSRTVNISTFTGCKDRNCKVTCTNVENLYTTLYETLILSTCISTDVLHIKEQQFHKGIIKNSWENIERSVYEILLHNSSVKYVKSDTFNTLMFSSTFLLSWQNLEPDLIVESGALLGLHSLRYLLIETHIERLDRAFFQPVQMSLMHLKLNCGMNVRNQNIFGISTLLNLEYVDLSHNNFNDGITKKTFASTPNLKYIRMIDSKILFIDKDAFSRSIGKLTVLNLSENKLIYLDANSIESLLTSPGTKTFMNFAMNDLYCGCEIYPFAKIYMKYRSQFIDALYCTKPYYYYGYFINEINYTDCEMAATTIATTIRDTAITTTTVPFNSDGDTAPILDEDIDPDWNISIEQPIYNDTLFEMRCLNIIDDADNSDSKLKSSEIIASTSSETDSKSPELSIADFVVDLLKKNVSADLWYDQIEKKDREMFKLQPRSHEFELLLYTNSSVRVTVKDALSESTDINIIWFTDVKEPLIYDCMNYRNPYFVTDALQKNTTYTFCLTIQSTPAISPMDCLPLYVSAVTISDKRIWISKEDKAMTLGVMCLIYLLSTIFGGIAGYFGIKYYPDLLEGSKNVLMVKKCEQTCYISTISEAEHLKNSIIKKQLPRKRDSFNSPLPEIPQSAAYGTPLNIDLKDLECIYSTSTLEGSFVPMTLPDDLYEMPDFNTKTNKRYVSNAYSCSPSTPPPLPMQNSVIGKDFTEYFSPKLN